MAHTPERKVKDKVVALLKQYDAYFFSPLSNGFGRSGIPDIIACLYGRYIAIECKAGDNKPTALQIRELGLITKAGGVALVIRENNINEVALALQSIKEEHDNTK
jgi:Holliday junction resolvase